MIITHTMADGTTRKSIEDYEIPFNADTEVVYDLLVKWTTNKEKEDTA